MGKVIITEPSKRVIRITSRGKTVNVAPNSSRLIKVISVGPQGPAGADGEGVPTGGTTRQALTKIDGTDNNTEWSYDWMQIAGNIKYNGTTTDIAAGRVLEGTFTGLGLIYRFITTAKTGKYPTEDSFYRDFDGTNLTNLLATRGQ